MELLPNEITLEIFLFLPKQILWRIVRLLSKEFQELVLLHFRRQKLILYPGIENIEKIEGYSLFYKLQLNKLGSLIHLRGLKQLNLNDTQVSKIENLPAGLEELDLSYTKVSKIDRQNWQSSKQRIKS